MPTRALAVAGVFALAIAGYVHWGAPSSARASHSPARVAETAPPIADGAKSPFGADCSSDAQCASNACNKGKQGAFCSMRCSKDSDCPSPPSGGSCNNRGFCKR